MPTGLIIIIILAVIIILVIAAKAGCLGETIGDIIDILGDIDFD